MSDFKKEDVIALANSVSEHCVTVEYNANDADSVECVFCYSPVPIKYGQNPPVDISKMINDFKHSPDCIALVAQDVLTRSRE